MRIVIEMEIESTDYGGQEFKGEIEKLLKDIDPSPATRLVAFKMQEDGGLGKWDKRAIDWHED